MLSSLSYEETTEIMSSRKRPLEDTDFKEVKEMVESLWWKKESEAASDAITQHE